MLYYSGLFFLVCNDPLLDLSLLLLVLLHILEYNFDYHEVLLHFNKKEKNVSI